MLSLLEDISDPLFIIDQVELRLIFVNRRATELFGKPAEDLVGTLLFDALPKEDEATWLNAATEAMTHKTIQRCKVRLPTNNHWLNLHFYPQSRDLIVRCEEEPIAS